MRNNLDFPVKHNYVSYLPKSGESTQSEDDCGGTSSQCEDGNFAKLSPVLELGGKHNQDI